MEPKPTCEHRGHEDGRHDAGRFEWERALRSDPSITGTLLLILLTLATYMNADGSNAYVSQLTLAEVTGLKERAIGGHLRAAVKTGLLRLESRGHRKGDGSTVSSRYRATLPQPASGCTLTSTGTPVPEEDLNRHETTSQPARNDASTGTPVPPTKGDQEDQEGGEPSLVAVAAALCSQPRDPHQRRQEINGKLARLRRAHSDETLRQVLASIVDDEMRFGFPTELFGEVEERLPTVAQPDVIDRRPEPYANPYDLDDNGQLIKKEPAA